MTQDNSNTFKTSDVQRARNKRWRDAHPEQMKAIRARWVKDNQEYDRKRRAAKQKKRRSEDPEKYREQLREWRSNNKDKTRSHNIKYKETHREELALIQRARNYGTKAKIDKTLIHNWGSRICGICKLPVEGKFHLDHIIPLSKNGPHAETNLQLAHPFCNLSKKDKLLT